MGNLRSSSKGEVVVEFFAKEACLRLGRSQTLRCRKYCILGCDCNSSSSNIRKRISFRGDVALVLWSGFFEDECEF